MTEDGITQRLERSLDRVRKELNEAIDDSQDAGEKLRSEIKTSIDGLDAQLDKLPPAA